MILFLDKLRQHRIIVTVVILFAIASIAYAWYPPFRLLTWVAAGRSLDCPMAQALQSERNEQLEKELNDRIIKQSKLISTDVEGLELWETPKGRFWIPRGSRYLLPLNLAEQERKIYGTGDAGPHADDIALDYRAGIGVTVNEELLAGAEKIVAIESAPESLECLGRNFSNEIATGRIILYPKGLGDTTIDGIVGELKLPRVDYIKLDIEDAESRALAGARDTISRFKPRISIANYRQTGHPGLISQIIRGIRPDYQVRCGPCAQMKDSHSIRPDVLYFK